MAGSLNKVMLIGNLGADPEVRFTGDGKPVANFRLATSKKWNDKNGKLQERTEWHRVVVWGKTAEAIGKYLKKGSKVYVEGELRTNEYEKDGIKRYSTEIVADNFAGVVFLSQKRAGTEGGDSDKQQHFEDNEPNPSAEDDDIPF